MKLKNVRIQNYKCIDDSGEFSLAQVTCLVGKNESGKSAILQALYKLKPVETEKQHFDYLEEYPRKDLIDYEKIKDNEPANILTTTWEIEKSDEKMFENKFGINPINNNAGVTLNAGFDNIRHWTVELDETKLLDHYLKFLTGEVPEDSVKSLKDLISHLGNVKTPSQNQKSILDRLNTNIPGGDLSKAVLNTLANLLPTFVYFPDYEKMAGRVAFEELKKHMTPPNTLRFSEKIFLALLDLAGTSPEEIQKLGTLEHLIARLEGVSNKLTKEIFEYWSQNEYLRVNFLFESARPSDSPPFNSGYIFLTRIENTRHQVSVNFEDRSSGFVWFFSFLVWFSQVRKNYGDNLFLLLDEPGLSLHAKAQSDLLKYIDEKLKPHFQIIYTAHSPFMIDPDNLLSVRTAEDVVQNKKLLGTKVGDRVLSTDSDTLFPLQAALGYEITQTLFVGKHTLLVEGPSDLLYLKWFSKELVTLGRTHLDPRWVISPAGGVDKVGSFLTLFGGNKLHVAVLTDFHEGIKKKVRTLRDSEILKKGHVFSAEMYADQEEADIEDVMGRSLYVYLINECYNLPNGKKLPLTKPEDAPRRVIVEVEDFFRSLPVGFSEFDHYQPASYLIENSLILRNKLPGFDRALDHFEKLFKDLNSILKEYDKNNC